MTDLVRDPSTWWLVGVLIVMCAIQARISREPWHDVAIRGIGLGAFVLGLRWVALAQPELLLPLALATGGFALAVWSPKLPVRRARQSESGEY